ncbi:MAG TPA: protein kinase [Phycisphaerae bacterium]|nr:protein kinase [Phycisphaerae bacterium]HNU45845.1 protein kinase [Phycisphaerae bacterium]
MSSASEESQLARAVVDRRLCTAAEVDLARTELRHLLAQGNGATLADLLVQRGFVTRSQVERISLDLDDDSMYRPAQQIPGFQILGKIGQGAMAVVFKARQLSLDRVVAIKVLPRRLSENQEFVDRFYREGRAAAQLNHPNIVGAYDVGEAGGYHYFVMEYIDGQTAYDILQQKGRMDEKAALECVLQVARALEHAHARGFIHRDVKPKNIMLTKAGVVKLADMGLAREVSDYETAAAEAGRAYGTPYYISPEQIRGEIKIDFRADIYALGATFYHMVTGRVPYDGPTPSVVMHKHLKEPLIPPDHVNTRLSSGIGEIIEVMMAKNPDDRYASTSDLIEDLQAVANGQPPLQARKRYDHDLLRSLATTGQIIPSKAEERSPSESAANPWLVPLGVVLGVSLLLNVILVIALLTASP